jgi:hypothetical protein
MVNRTNKLPAFVFDAWLPNTDDPPAKRGLRLMTEHMTQLWRARPGGYPWIAEEGDIAVYVAKHFEVVEVHMGLPVERETVSQIWSAVHGRGEVMGTDGFPDTLHVF